MQEDLEEGCLTSHIKVVYFAKQEEDTLTHVYYHVEKSVLVFPVPFTIDYIFRCKVLFSDVIFRCLSVQGPRSPPVLCKSAEHRRTGGRELWDANLVINQGAQFVKWIFLFLS